MSVRTDLALESVKNINKKLEGINQIEREGHGIKVTEITVLNENVGAKIGKGKGKYITIETGDLAIHPEEFNEIVEAIAEEIRRLSPKDGCVMILGLGNNDITPDALGPKVVSRIVATRHLKENLPPSHELYNIASVSALAPGVLGQTGIEVAEIAKAVCDKTKPALVVVIDALACADVERLGTTIQLTDTGISPGSGVKNSRKEISSNTLGVPVVAIGVPTVVDMHTIAENISGNAPLKNMPNMMVTPRDIDKIIERTAKLLAYSINRCFLPNFSIEELDIMS